MKGVIKALSTAEARWWAANIVASLINAPCAGVLITIAEVPSTSRNCPGCRFSALQRPTSGPYAYECLRCGATYLAADLRGDPL